MPPKSKNIVKMVQQIFVEITSDKTFPYVEDASLVKQVGCAIANRFGVESKKVRVNTHDVANHIAQVKIEDISIAVTKKSAKLKLYQEKNGNMSLLCEAQLPEVKKKTGGASSSST